MADRQVNFTGKDKDGVITKLCGGAGETWSPRSKADAITDIDNKLHTYFVLWPPKSERTEVRVVDGTSGKYLRTDRDTTTRNNLLDLPDS